MAPPPRPYVSPGLCRPWLVFTCRFAVYVALARRTSGSAVFTPVIVPPTEGYPEPSGRSAGPAVDGLLPVPGFTKTPKKTAGAGLPAWGARHLPAKRGAPAPHAGRSRLLAPATPAL